MSGWNLFGKAKNLSEEQLLTYLGRDWYHVETDGHFHKTIQVMGYAFESVDIGEGPYRIVDYGWFRIDPNGFNADLDLEGNVIHSSVEPCGKERVLTYLRHIASLPELPMDEVNDRTPEGYYCS